MIFALRRLAHSGGLVAAAFALKYPLIALPNVEPLTLVFFAIGYAYGPLWGAFVGLLSEGIFATFNPLGIPIFPVWMAQLGAMALTGLAGGWFGRLVRRREERRVSRLAVIAAGITVTVIFDLATNTAFAISIGPFWPIMVAALPFAAIHIGSNALLFGAIFPILERWLLRPTTAVVGPSSY